MIDERFIYLALALSFYGAFNYLISTLKGETKPNKVSWFLWSLAPFIAFLAQIQQGVGLVSLMTLVIALNTFLIFVASFLNKKAQWKITTFDLICGALSLFGLALWGITRAGNLAILFAILADGLAAIPTVVKSYYAPETENYQAYFFGGLASVITLLTIKNWNFANAAFSIYIFFLCLLVVLFVKFKLGKKLIKNH